MNVIRIPKVIKFGKNALSEADYPKNALVVTTAPPDVSSKWLARMKITDHFLFDKVEPEPSIETVQKVISEYKTKNLSAIIGLGGGSSQDVAKYAGTELKIPKILVYFESKMVFLPMTSLSFFTIFCNVLSGNAAPSPVSRMPSASFFSRFVASSLKFFIITSWND